MVENFDVVKEPNGEEWLIIDTTVADPTYLFRTFVRSTHFKKEADGSKWDPQPCIVSGEAGATFRLARAGKAGPTSTCSDIHQRRAAAHDERAAALEADLACA
jgi:hypothetical protein